MDTLHAILVLSDKFPDVINASFINEQLGSTEVIDETSVAPIAVILMVRIFLSLGRLWQEKNVFL